MRKCRSPDSLQHQEKACLRDDDGDRVQHRRRGRCIGQRDTERHHPRPRLVDNAKTRFRDILFECVIVIAAQHLQILLADLALRREAASRVGSIFNQREIMQPFTGFFFPERLRKLG